MLELREKSADTLALSYAGDTFNTAYYLANSGVPMQVNYATVLGVDKHSTEMVEGMSADGIGTRLIGRDTERGPGLYMISVDAHGERSFTYYRSDSAARTLFSSGYTNAHATEIEAADLIYFSGITLSILSPEARERLLRVIDVARGRGAKIAFDSNYRAQSWPRAEAAKENFTEVYSRTDIALPSFDDERLLFGDESIAACANRVAEYGVGEIVVKHGAEPGMWICADGTTGEFSPRHVDTVIDTTGAGDSFNGGYLAARLHGEHPERACVSASALAGTVTQRRGAIVPRGELKNLWSM